MLFPGNSEQRARWHGPASPSVFHWHGVHSAAAVGPEDRPSGALRKRHWPFSPLRNHGWSGFPHGKDSCIPDALVF